MKIIDLSHRINSDMSTYPSDPDFLITREKEILNDRALLHSFSMGTHTGTHVDAPSHIITNGKSLDSFNLTYFTGLTLKVNIDSFIDLNHFEKNIDGIIFETGWYKHFSSPEKFYGPKRPEIPKQLISRILEMKCKFFGCDLPSVDISGSINKPIHNSLLKSEILIYESLTNLDKIPLNQPFEFYGFPLPIDGIEGSPVRAVGII